MKFHPAANALPLVEGDDYAGMRDDIAANGLRNPIRTFDDMIIDGRNRYRICKELGIEPKYVALTLKQIGGCPFRFVASENLHRRHMTISQRALAAAELADMMAATEGPPDEICAPLDFSGKQGSSAPPRWRKPQETMAASMQVGERSVERARRVLEDGAKPVAEAVRDGMITLDVAEKLIAAEPDKKAQAALVREAKKKPHAAKELKRAIAGAKEEAAAEEAEKPAEDSVGQPIPKKLLPIFERCSEFDAQVKAITAIQKWAKEIETDDCAIWLHVQSLVADLKNAKTALKFNRPYAVCPYCQAKKQSCEACKGAGFVNKTLYDGAPQELRV